jgi:hypothetical protein
MAHRDRFELPARDRPFVEMPYPLEGCPAAPLELFDSI